MTRARASRTFETSLQVQDRCAELAVAKDVLDPAAKVFRARDGLPRHRPARPVAPRVDHEPFERASRRTALLCEYELLLAMHCHGLLFNRGGRPVAKRDHEWVVG